MIVLTGKLALTSAKALPATPADTEKSLYACDANARFAKGALKATEERERTPRRVLEKRIMRACCVALKSETGMKSLRSLKDGTMN
jgi:hypothetical protein